MDNHCTTVRPVIMAHCGPACTSQYPTRWRQVTWYTHLLGGWCHEETHTWQSYLIGSKHAGAVGVCLEEAPEAPEEPGDAQCSCCGRYYWSGTGHRKLAICRWCLQ